MSDLPNTQLSRAGIVGTTAVKIGVGKLKSKVKRPFLDDSAKLAEKAKQEDADAEILFKAITQLRGTAVKMAQMLGMETELLPERIRTELAKSYHQIPPLNRVLVRNMKLLSKLSASGMKFLPKHRQPNKDVIENTVQEIGDRLREETDYLLEAENTRWFKNNFHLDGIDVPKVFDDYSSSRVITTQMLDGQHLDDWLASNPSQEQRDRAAQLIYDSFIHSTTVLGRTHADPNPGNYLYAKDGRIGLIDFGCIKKFSPRFVENIPTLLRAFYRNELQEIYDAYADLGTTIKNDNIQDYESVLQPFGKWLSLPLQESFFDFKENASYTSTGRALLQQLSEMPSLETVDKDFIFFDRTFYGMFKVFEKLQAKVYMRHHWEALWG